MSEKNVRELANVIYHEARGEPLRGQVAVGHVVLNRVKDPRYPDSIHAVVWQPKQFTGIRYHSGWQRFEKLAREILQGLHENPIGNSLSFRSFSTKKARFRIGNHWFW